MVHPVTIVGGGPSGASAALAALAEDRPVSIFERSKFPRHKVCGEFFSPEVADELDRLGAWDAFQSAGPSTIRRMELHFGQRVKTSRLPDCGWGLSRHAFDALLLRRAEASGAQMLADAPTRTLAGQVIATGRAGAPDRNATPGRSRLFGFKAHFDGPTQDAVELYFFGPCYVGLNPVEGGRTNVCGLAPEDFLRRFDFDYDALLRESEPLGRRVAPLSRSMKWLTTGPLCYRQQFASDGLHYRTGDALSFVDPFTGSGLLAAVKTGSLAGRAAARDEPVDKYLAQCRESLGKPFAAASLFRATLRLGWADALAGIVPGRLLFALTRPR